MDRKFDEGEDEEHLHTDLRWVEVFFIDTRKYK